jgi:MFS transporter, DHA1 family, multidrug resistance protein
VDSWFNAYLGGSFLLALPSWQDRLARSPSCAFRRRFPSTDECPSIRQERAKSCLLRLPTFAYTAVFGLIASAQLVFGVVAPFLYQQNLGLSAGAYGLIALLIGGANLAGEVACTSLATRPSPRQLCFGALSVYLLGTLLLLLSGLLLGASFFPITLGGMLALAGCGTLCPTMYGMALGLFSRNLGLLGGFISSLCYLAVSVTMALAAYLPETSQAPLGWVYLAIGTIAALLLGTSLPGEETSSSHS